MNMTATLAQVLAKRALSCVEIDLDEGDLNGPEVRLTDLDQYSDAAVGPRGAVFVTPGQLEFACDQYRQVSGEDISAELLISKLEWA